MEGCYSLFSRRAEEGTGGIGGNRSAVTPTIWVRIRAHTQTCVVTDISTPAYNHHPFLENDFLIRKVLFRALRAPR